LACLYLRRLASLGWRVVASLSRPYGAPRAT